MGRWEVGERRPKWRRNAAQHRLVNAIYEVVGCSLRTFML